MSKRTVIYTRYSSDMQRPESCADQEREVRRGLALLGVDTDDAVVIKDEAESGTKTHRDCYRDLMRMVRRGEVGVLAVDDQARFSRAEGTYAAITDLVYSGGRFVSTGESIDTDREGWELQVKIMEIHNGASTRELARRVHRGQKGRVLDDGSAGDQPYGYESYYLDPASVNTSRRGPKPKKGLRVCDAEARWVRQVFEWFTVEEMSISGIARELTRRDVPKGTKATTPGWYHQQVRRMLANPKYVGRWTWGKTKTMRNSEGKTKQILVPTEELVVRDRPDLRLVEQETWERAQERLRRLGEAFGPQPGQKRRGPKTHHTDVYPSGLLNGLLYCHSCGARLWKRPAKKGGYFTCPARVKGVCPMATQVPVARAEKAVLEFVAGLLRSWPPWLGKATAEVRRSVAAARDRLPESVAADEAQLATCEKKIANLVGQLEDGPTESPAIRGRLTKLEREAAALRARLDGAAKFRVDSVALPDDDWVRAKLSGLAELLKADDRETAVLLKRLLGRVTAEAVVAPGKTRGFVRLRVSVEATRLLEEVLGGRLPPGVLGAAAASATAEPAGFELDLGRPTRRDLLAPEVAARRARGETWEYIGKATGLGTGNAHNVYTRWAAAQPGPA